MPLTRSEHDEHMDRLMMKIAVQLEGEKLLDCAACAAAIVSSSLFYEPDRDNKLRELIDFIRGLWALAEKREGDATH